MNECDDQTSTKQEGFAREDIRPAACRSAVKYLLPLCGNASVSSTTMERLFLG
jgi:hypothetical protein